MLYQEVRQCVDELIRFSERCPYYFGLESEIYELAAGIQDFEALKTALEQLKAWNQNTNESSTRKSYKQMAAKYKYIVQVLASPKFCTPKGNRSLHWPCHGYTHLVQHLIAAGADVNALDSFGNNPLMVVVNPSPSDPIDEEGRMKIAKLLLDAGTSITTETFPTQNHSSEGQTKKPDNPIKLAIKNNFAGIVEMMLTHPRSKPEQIDIDWVKISIYEDRGVILSHLIKAGLDVNGKIIAEGLNISFVGSAIVLDKTACAITLLKAGAKIPPDGSAIVHTIIKTQNYALTEALLQAGDNPNASLNKDGFTLLHFAVTQGNIDLVKLLITHRANVNSQDKDGNTPLMLAAIKRDLPMLHFLLKNGANTTHRNYANLHAQHMFVFGDGAVRINQLPIPNEDLLDDEDEDNRMNLDTGPNL